MKRLNALALPALLLVATVAVARDQQASPAAPAAPVARRVPSSSTIHGETRVDEYAWLRDKTNPEVTAHLEAENAYANALIEPIAGFSKNLYGEMLGRIKQTDVNVPYLKNGWYYYSRTVEGKQYLIHARKRTLDGAEEIMLDVNKLGEGQKFMGIGALEVSDDGNLLAYSTDNTGYRQYRLQVKDLRTGRLLPDTAEKTGSVLWAKDNKTIFYTVENAAKRQWRFYRHTLGSSEADVLVYEEADELYDLYAERSRSGESIFIISESATTNEARFLPSADPTATPRVITPRKTDLKYYPEHRGDRLYLMTNDVGINYRIVSAPMGDPQQKNWTEVVAFRKPVKIDSLDAFRNHLVLRVRENGLSHIEVLDLRDNKKHRVSFPEPAYVVLGGANAEFDTNLFRYTYQSLVTPSSTFDYSMDARKSTLLKRTEVLGGFDPARYKSERIFATATDGVKIPIALVYRKDVNPRGRNPLLLYAYGSYGSSTPDSFSTNRLALLNRGVVYAIAHIRGGGEMGKEWHEAGRMMTKKNTFSDFTAAASHLVKEKYTSPDKLAIMGGSAGGLLMGAVVNMRPDLFKAVVAYVPFVDVINTMLDASIPLTTQEYIEWGNPNDKEAYAYMKSYDPYSNIAKTKYPAMLVRTSLNDSQVGYWEAAKWVAKLRATKTDKNPILFRINMGAGHGGSSGRYDKLKEEAADYAWLLSQLGITK